MASESLQSQIFGVFSSAYRLWNDRAMGSNFVHFFQESQILSENSGGPNKGKTAIYRALLYFNLPHKYIFNLQIKPKLGRFRFPPDDPSEEVKLQQLTIEQEKDESKNGSNIILMEVEPDEPDVQDPKSYIIGGYASHMWKADNDDKGDETCFLFNLTQNLRFNARQSAHERLTWQRTSMIDNALVN